MNSIKPDDPDHEFYEEPRCPDCGAETESDLCDVIGCDDGWIDDYDDDPVNYSPGESYEECTNCSGTGIVRWCPKCEVDYWAAMRRKEFEK